MKMPKAIYINSILFVLFLLIYCAHENTNNNIAATIIAIKSIILNPTAGIPPNKAKLLTFDTYPTYSKLMYDNSLLVYFEFKER